MADLTLLTRADNGGPLTAPWAIDPPWDTPVWAERAKGDDMTDTMFSTEDEKLYRSYAAMQGDDEPVVILTAEEVADLQRRAAYVDADEEASLYWNYVQFVGAV